MKTLSLAACIQDVIRLWARSPLKLAIILLALHLVLGLGRVSLAASIVCAVVSLFVLVGYMANQDQHTGREYNLVKDCVPLALVFALMIVSCWFVFRVLFSLQNDTPQQILTFWFDWQLSDTALADMSFMQKASWLYASSLVTLIFVWLMLASFGSWFSYPLMVFQQLSWSQARYQGRQLFRQHVGIMYQLSALLIVLSLLCVAIAPVFIPFLYIVFASLMYVSLQRLQSF